MTEPVPIEPASDAEGLLSGPLELRLDEEYLPLTALNATPHLLDTILPFGQVYRNGDILRLRLWPDTIWSSVPAPEGDFRTTDIGHGLARFRLRGNEALQFIANYATADLLDTQIQTAQAIRTAINGFDCTIWWEDARDVQLLVDRSLAQSFSEHMRLLARRHTPANPSP